MTPASIRNNNPGAMEPGPSSRKFGSTSFETLHWTYQGKPATNKIATFPTPIHGAAALFDLLYAKYTGSTVEKAITRWCGGYFSATYTGVLEQKCGIKPDSQLTKGVVRDAETAIMLAKAMAFQEAGREFPMSDADWRKAHDMAFAGSVAPEPSADNDVPFPRPEARQRAAVKDAAQKGGLVTGGVVALEGARQAVDKGKEIKSVVEDARGLVPAVPKSLPLPFVGVGLVLAAVLFIGFVVVRARG